MAKRKTAKTIPKAHAKPAPKPVPAKAKPMADKPVAVQQVAAPAPKQQAAPKQQSAADILGVIAGTFDRGPHGIVGELTAQAIIDNLTAAGYTIS